MLLLFGFGLTVIVVIKQHTGIVQSDTFFAVQKQAFGLDGHCGTAGQMDYGLCKADAGDAQLYPG